MSTTARLLRVILPALLLAVAACGEAPRMDKDYTSPRGTMQTFLHAMNDVSKRGAGNERVHDAVSCFDTKCSFEEGWKLCWDFLDVLDRAVGRIETEEYSSRPDAAPVTLLEMDGKPAIVLARTPVTGRWQFTAGTVAAMPELVAEFGKGGLRDGLRGSPAWARKVAWIRERMPSGMRRVGFILEHWQWGALFVLVLVGFLVDRLLVLILLGLVGLALKRRRIETDRDLRRNAVRPLGLLALSLVWWAGIPQLAMPAAILVVLMVVAKGLAAVAVVWSAWRLVDLVTDYLLRKARGTETRVDDVLVPLVRKTAKVFIAAFGLVFIADNLAIDVTSLLAGLGLGGLAFALAAKETVANLFGSVTVLLDRPFDVGDWVRIDGVDGNVENIGFRSTRVRTFHNSVIAIPNSQLITAVVDNMGARRYRRIKTMLSITYDTPPEKIEAFCEGVRELIRRHPYTRKDTYHVYLNALSASSLDVLLYCFVETPDWATELREKHRLFADILRLASRLGVEFAFPTQTLYVEKTEAPGEPGPVSGKDEIDGATSLGRREAAAILKATIPSGTRPPPVSLGAQPLDPDLDREKAGGEEG
jgi:MscS family membrane protein